MGPEVALLGRRGQRRGSSAQSRDQSQVILPLSTLPLAAVAAGPACPQKLSSETSHGPAQYLGRTLDHSLSDLDAEVAYREVLIHMLELYRACLHFSIASSLSLLKG